MIVQNLNYGTNQYSVDNSKFELCDTSMKTRDKNNFADSSKNELELYSDRGVGRRTPFIQNKGL
ncbi:hypothetical protein EfmAA94_27130 [Enterococcus faecium]|nr:hypothetical protein EfmAA94_27130 [Enterococcus faecium]